MGDALYKWKRKMNKERDKINERRERKSESGRGG